MKTEKQKNRKFQIQAAAYTLLAQKGYQGTSMLAIAKQARASNETLYAWYGNKQGLFQSLIEENAGEVITSLRSAIKHDATLEQTLMRVGELLLRLVTSDKAIILNRAAAADVSDSGTLGSSLAKFGRESVAPLLGELFDRAKDRGELYFDDRNDITSTYLGLLIGDTQIRRVIGVLPPLDDNEIHARVYHATDRILRLFGVPTN